MQTRSSVCVFPQVPGFSSRAFLLVVLTTTLAAAGRGRAQEAAADRFAAPLVVPTPTDNYPHSYRSPTGKNEGFAVDLLDAVARVMDLELRRVSAPSHDMRPGLLAREYDIIPMYSYEPGREAFVSFSASYLELQGGLFRNRNNAHVKEPGDLAGRAVLVVGPGSPGERFVRQRLPQARVVYANGGEDGLKRLQAGEAEGLFLTRLTALSAIERYGFRDVAPLGPPLSDYGVRLCFAVRRDDTVLLARLNEGLAILRRTGEFDAIYQRWFGQFDVRRFSGQELVVALAGVLALALCLALWALRRQRQLRRRIARQAEELTESRAILAEAQAFAHLGHWRRAVGPAGEVTWSEETFRIFERDPSLGPPRTLEELTLVAGQADAARWRAQLERAMRENHAFTLDVPIEPRPGRRKIIHVRGRSRHDAQGRIEAVFGTAQDITARRFAEQALHESEQLLRALYETLPSALLVLERADARWSFVSLNPAALRLCGLERMPAAGAPAFDADQPLARQGWWRELIERAEGLAGPVMMEFQREDLRREFVATLVPLHAPNGRARCCFLVEDATDRKQKDAEIAQGRRLRAIGELVGGIAHEFNNLLTPVVLKSDLLMREWAHEPELTADHALIAQAASRAADLTRRLLAFGRKTDPAPEVVRLPATVEANLELLRHTIDRRIRLSTTVPDDLPPLWVNGGDVNQILINLLLNARDTLEEKLAGAPPEGWTPQIVVGATRVVKSATVPPMPVPASANGAETWLRLTVTDNGLGMPPAVVERAFEPFYTTKPVGRGTGLGLATVWHLATSLGGRIEVDSTEGQGTTFCVSLPVRAVPPGVRVAEPAAAPAKSGKLRLLVAEDEESIARVLLGVLGRDGHDVTLATNGREAWEIFSANAGKFDALLFDLNMPEVTGLEFARRVRAQSYRGRMLVMSGRVSEEDRAEIAALGINGVVEKPFTLGELRGALARAMSADGGAADGA